MPAISSKEIEAPASAHRGAAPNQVAHQPAGRGPSLDQSFRLHLDSQRNPQVLGRRHLFTSPFHSRGPNRLQIAPQQAAIGAAVQVRGSGGRQWSIRLLFQDSLELRALDWAHRISFHHDDLFDFDTLIAAARTALGSLPLFARAAAFELLQQLPQSHARLV